MNYTPKQLYDAALELALAIQDRADIRLFGLIDAKTSANPEYTGVTLLNYSPECAFKKADDWNIYERVSRGLIVFKGKVLAFPFPKFFNFGDEVKDFAPSDIQTVMKKEDGSLGIVFLHNGNIHVTTHGSLDSDQGKWATNFARKNKMTLAPNQTQLTEIIYPENRVVTDYGTREELIDLGSYHIIDGKAIYSPPSNTESTVTSVTDLKKFCSENSDYNVEGFVILLKNGIRVKFKTDAYLAVHRIRFAISEKRIQEILIENETLLEDWKKTLPNEFFKEVDMIAKEIKSVSYKHLVFVQEVLLDAVNTIPDFLTLDYRQKKSNLAKYFRDHFSNHLHFSLGMTLFDRGPSDAMNQTLKCYFEFKDLDI